MAGAALFAGAAVAAPAPLPSPSPDFQFVREVDSTVDTERARAPELVGLIVNGRERPDAVAYRPAVGGAPADTALEILLQAASLPWSRGDAAWIITTPIGDTRILDTDTAEVDGVTYVPLDRLAERLAASVVYAESDTAIRIDLPWDPEATADLRPRESAHEPDIRAPNASLSSLSANAVATHSDGEWRSSLSATVGGLLGPGYWNGELLVTDAGDERHVEVPSLWWLLDRGRSRTLIGIDQVYLHPLVEGLEMTGVQYAWTNSPGIVYGKDALYTTSGTGQLVPYGASPTSVVRGTGPPGGTAELRIGGQPVARQAIGYDGRYEFREVPARPGDALRVQVALYEFGRPSIPIRVDDYLSQAGNLQLPAGTTVHYVGAGRADNPLRDSSFTQLEGNAGFYQFRHGLNDRVTLDLITQATDNQQVTLAGAAFNLGAAGAWAAYAGTGEGGANGWQVLGEGQRQEWFWRADLLKRDAGFWREADLGVDSRRVEAGRYFGDRVRASMIYGHYEDGVREEIDYFKPALDWRVTDAVTLSAQPDFDGRYAYRAGWMINEATYASATRYSGVDQVDFVRRLTPSLSGRLSALRDDDGDEQFGAFLNGYSASLRRLSWTAGILQGEGRTGYQGSVNFELIPGVLAQLLVQRNATLGDVDSGTSVQVAITADLAITRGGVSPAFGAAAQARRFGAMSGGIDLPDGAGMSADELAGLAILVDGRIRTRTVAGGRFTVDLLEPGTYQVQLDGEGLPIELAVNEPPRWVEVRAGGVTEIEFSASLSLGCAGRVDPPTPAPDARWTVVAVDDAGADRATATTTAFGYYRLDGLSPGRYSIQLRRPDGTQIAGLPVELTTEFLFNQNLTPGSP